MSTMDSGSGSVTGEPERKRQRRLLPSPSQSPSEPNPYSSIRSQLAALNCDFDPVRKVLNGCKSSNGAEAKMPSTPTDPHNLRGVRNKAGLEMLQGDQFTVKVCMACVERKKWVLPRRLLTSHSPYFARMSLEKTEDIFSILDEGPFELFTQWLYLGELDFDDGNVPSETLVRAWALGNEFQCPAFRDHVMVQLIKLHHERGIKPRTLRDSFDLPYSGLWLRKWAIDQFHAKITYGYTGYDDQKEDDPGDKDTWKQYATEVKAFSQKFLAASLDAGQGVNRARKPWENGQRYMEVLKYAEIGAYKEESRSMKVEDTLVKAEGR